MMPLADTAWWLAIVCFWGASMLFTSLTASLGWQIIIDLGIGGMQDLHGFDVFISSGHQFGCTLRAHSKTSVWDRGVLAPDY